jgi:hypothetical protein
MCADDALELKKGVGTTFFTIDTPLAILARAQKDNAKDLIDATKRWKPWLPPKSDQGLQQGGAFVFEGEDLLFSHYDPSSTVLPWPIERITKIRFAFALSLLVGHKS